MKLTLDRINHSGITNYNSNYYYSNKNEDDDDDVFLNIDSNRFEKLSQKHSYDFTKKKALNKYHNSVNKLEISLSDSNHSILKKKLKKKSSTCADFKTLHGNSRQNSNSSVNSEDNTEFILNNYDMKHTAT
jgi:hypothetical protein